MEEASDVQRHEIHNAAQNRSHNTEEIEGVNSYNAPFSSLK